MEVDELIRNAPVEQQVALSSFHLTYSNQQCFQFESVLSLRSGAKCIFAQFHEESAAFLPVAHDYSPNNDVVLDFIDSVTDRRKFLALAAPDSTVILYEVDDKDFEEK